jgi:hypothetical protein|nr:MAG TPA: hypothetical protein [Caudoviricetes sp.]
MVVNEEIEVTMQECEEIDVTTQEQNDIDADVGEGKYNVNTVVSNNYEDLENKPSINGTILIEDKTAEELNLQEKLNKGDNIEIKDNVISVITTNDVEGDNTKPITSAGVYTIVGNINVLLQII